MKNITILSMIVALLLVISQVCCQNGRRPGGGRYENRQQYPRPSSPSPGGRRFGEEYGWQYQQGGGYWYHPQSMWRWQPSNGWRDYSSDRYYYKR